MLECSAVGKVWFALALVWACGAVVPALAGETPNTAAPQPLVLSLSRDYPPFCFVDGDGAPRGILVQYWQAWARQTGTPVEFRPALWHECLETVRQGHADFIPGAFYSPERDRDLDFSSTFMDVHTCLYVEADAPYGSLVDLDGGPVGVTRDDRAEEMLRRVWPELSLRVYEGFGSLVQAALDGEVPAFVMDQPVAAYHLRTLGAGVRFRQAEVIYTGKLCAAVQEGNLELLRQINRGIEGMDPGVTASIFEEWEAQSSEPWLRVVAWGALGLVAAAAAGAVVLGLFNQRLRRAIRAQTAALAQVNQDLALEIERHRKVEEQLAQSRSRYLSIFSNIQDIYYETSLDGTILELSPSVEQASKYSRAELLGSPLSALYARPEDRDAFLAALRDKGRVTDYEVLLRDADGEVIPCAVTSSLILGADGRPEKIAGVLRDIREHKQAQAALVRSEQLAAIGTLAGGVAHEFNNVNTSILGYAGLLLEEESLSAEGRDFVERVRRAALHAKYITQNLLSFTRPPRGRAESADLNDVVRNALALLERELEIEGICVAQTLGAAEPVSCDTGQLGQVLLNLLINARHAVDGAAEKTITVSTGVTGDEAWVQVSDSGCGIEPEHLTQVFTPFFTTKGEHGVGDSPQRNQRGTGLGLSVSHSIVEQQGGRIAVASRPGEGSTFTVYLPIHRDDETPVAPAAGAPPGETPAASATQKARILVLDDEEDVQDVLTRMLRRAGYAAEATDDGAAALERLETEAFDLVLVDLQMPKMPGTEFLRQLAARPGSGPRCLVITGHNPAALGKGKDAWLGEYGYVPKPFERDDLLERVAGILQEQ